MWSSMNITINHFSKEFYILNIDFAGEYFLVAVVRKQLWWQFHRREQPKPSTRTYSALCYKGCATCHLLIRIWMEGSSFIGWFNLMDSEQDASVVVRKARHQHEFSSDHSSFNFIKKPESGRKGKERNIRLWRFLPDPLLSSKHSYQYYQS